MTGRSRSRVFVLMLALATLLATIALPGHATAAACHRGSRDSDHDSVPDCWEQRNGLVVGRRDALTDKDRDGLLAIHEFRLDASAGGIFGPYRANDPNSDNDGGFIKFGWIFPSLDGWEDLDGDGFVNTAERVWGTNGASAPSIPILPATGCIMVPGSVAHDGSRNVSLLLQAVLDTVPDGRCVRFRPNGRYRHDGTLKVVGRNDLLIEGNGAVLFTDRPGRLPAGAANSKRPHVQVIAGQNVTIDDLSIDGPNSSGEYRDVYEAEHGFDVKGAIGLTIRNSSVRQIYGDFVYLDDTEWPIHTGIHVPTQDLLVTGNSFRVAGRHGLGVSGDSVGVRFEDNSVRRVNRSAIDFEMHLGRAVSEFEIVGNTFQNFRHNWIAAGDGTVTDVYFGFNSILGASMHSKIVPRHLEVTHERWVFEGNVSNTQNPSDRSVFMISQSRDFTFIENVQPMAAGGNPVFLILSDVCGITLVDNSFSGMATLFDPAEPPPC